MLGKIAALLIMRKTMPPSGLLFQKLLAGMAAALAFTLIAALLAGVLIMGGIYLIYSALVAHGLEPQAAFTLMGCLVFLLMMVFVMAAYVCANNIRDIPKNILGAETNIVNRANGIVEAFLKGLLTSSDWS